MSFLSTGPIENAVSPVSGIRPTQQLTVKIDNRSSDTAASVEIYGYYLNGVRTEYVCEVLSVSPNQVITRDYFADFDGFEFIFETPLDGLDDTIQISVWGVDAEGQLVTAH
ncbi:YVTN family beta-propeller repeat-containing protein, partial [Paenibacillus sp. JW14]|nr:YVTN family beta-propeller repeat-containing protein [Paenibacillus agri]